LLRHSIVAKRKKKHQANWRYLVATYTIRYEGIGLGLIERAFIIQRIKIFNMKNEIKKIKVETPMEQVDEAIPTEEWYYIPFVYQSHVDLNGISSNYWQAISPYGCDLRNKQMAIDALATYSYLTVQHRKIVKIRMPITQPTPDEA